MHKRRGEELMQYYIMVVLATVLLAVDFVLQKTYQKSQGTSVKAGLRFNAGVGLGTAVLFYCLNGFSVSISLYAVLMAVGMSLCLLGYTLLGFRVLKAGNMSFYTMFLMTGGMVVPYVWGVLFLNESLSIKRVLGLLAILAAIIVSNCSKEKLSVKILFLCVGIFFLNGGSSVVSKLCQTPDHYGVVAPMEFVFWTGLVRFLLCTVLAVFVKEENAAEGAPAVSWKEIVWIVLGSALVSGISYQLQLVGAANLPATVLYPILSGGSIVFSSFADWICFGEKPNMLQWTGVLLCFAGTCLFV